MFRNFIITDIFLRFDIPIEQAIQNFFILGVFFLFDSLNTRYIQKMHFSQYFSNCDSCNFEVRAMRFFILFSTLISTNPSVGFLKF